MTSTRAFYETYWSQDGFLPTGQGLGSTLRKVLEHQLASRNTVLDVGCGDGAKVGVALAKRGIDTTESTYQLERSSWPGRTDWPRR
jgi:ribosomal protein L11 methylase PrmA